MFPPEALAHKYLATFYNSRMLFLYRCIVMAPERPAW